MISARAAQRAPRDGRVADTAIQYCVAIGKRYRPLQHIIVAYETKLDYTLLLSQFPFPFRCRADPYRHPDYEQRTSSVLMGTLFGVLDSSGTDAYACMDDAERSAAVVCDRWTFTCFCQATLPSVQHFTLSRTSFCSLVLPSQPSNPLRTSHKKDARSCTAPFVSKSVQTRFCNLKERQLEVVILD